MDFATVVDSVSGENYRNSVRGHSTRNQTQHSEPQFYLEDFRKMTQSKSVASRLSLDDR